MKLFERFRKQSKSAQTAPVNAEAASEDYLDDVTYIAGIKHIVGPWHQYDVMIAARGYGWEYMLGTADYLAGADLENISELTAGHSGSPAENLTDAFTKNGCKVSGVPELAEEKGFLSMAGISKALHAPVKIVFFNQTQLLRFFTLIDDVTLIEKYAETVIRRSFGTKDAMKRGKPLPKKPGN